MLDSRSQARGTGSTRLTSCGGKRRGDDGAIHVKHTNGSIQGDTALVNSDSNIDNSKCRSVGSVDDTGLEGISRDPKIKKVTDIGINISPFSDDERATLHFRPRYHHFRDFRGHSASVTLACAPICYLGFCSSIYYKLLRFLRLLVSHRIPAPEGPVSNDIICHLYL